MGKAVGGWLALWRLVVVAGATWTGIAQGAPAGLVVDLFPGNDLNFMQPFTSNPTFLTNVNGVLFFSACTQGDFGTPADCELWRSDGTAGGTVRVKDIFPGGSGTTANSGSPGNLINFNGTLLFAAGNASTGNPEPWISDGTAAGTGTNELKPGMNGSGGMGPFSVIGNYVLFPARTGAQFSYQLAKYDGVSSTVIKTFTTNGAEGILVTGAGPVFANLNGIAIFGAAADTLGQHYELWRSNGTTAGTTLVRDIYTGGTPPHSSNPQWFTTVGNTVFFQATTGNGTELWKTDGTFGGTGLVKNIFVGIDPNTQMPNSSTPTSLVNFNGTLFFNACNTNGCELWKSDGTSNGTVMVKNIFAGSQGNTPNSGSPSGLTVVGNTLFFAGCDGNGCELWKSDGTTNGTVMVKDINGGLGHSNPQELIAVNGHLYFTADDGVHGRELWVSDGTDTGTRMVIDLRPGSASAIDTNVGPGYLTNVNGTVFFVANNGVTGRELFRTFTNLLQVTKTGPGNGTVTSAPLGINCGGTCAFSFLDDFVITLTAVADANSTFTGWSGGGCSGIGLCQVTLSNATTVSANFNLLGVSTFSLTVVRAGTAPGSGSVTSSPPGIDCGPTCNAVFNAGTQVTLTASVAGGAVFTGWSGGGCSGTNPCQVTLNANTNVTAIFDAGSTLTVVRTGAGLVSSSVPGIACGGLCAQGFANGTQVTLTAQAAPGFEFGGFTGGGCGSTDPCTLTLGADTTVNATFNLVTPMAIQLFTNGAAFNTGQLLSLTAVAANPGPGGVGDFYLGAALPPDAGPGLGCPAGDALVFFTNGGAGFAISCLSSPASTFAPFLANVSVPGGLPPVVVPLFSFVWPAGAPPGPYSFFGAMTALSAFNSAALNFADVVAAGLAGVLFTP